MFPAVALLSFCFLAVVHAQQIGTLIPEVHPTLTWQTCTAGGACTTNAGSITLDANWRWLHSTRYIFLVNIVTMASSFVINSVVIPIVTLAMRGTRFCARIPSPAPQTARWMAPTIVIRSALPLLVMNLDSNTSTLERLRLLVRGCISWPIILSMSCSRF